jgi:parallel beta-helix repeat protein
VAPQNANGAAIVLQQGANHIMIDSTLLSHSVMGIWMGNAAGSDNIIRNNTITGNSNDGIAIDKIANPAGHATQITGNTITNNGIHGIELDGNNFVVSGNTVNGNGLYSAGASGIHVYGGAEGSPDGYGVGNTVTNNVTVGNHDLWAQDGNGIELDQYTHNNVVSNNFSAGNDGAGIAVYDSYGNTVANNTLVGNELDAGHTHTARGDLALNAHIGITANNIFSGNTGIANANSAAVFISSTSQSNNQFSANAWENQAGGPATQLGIDTSWASWLQYQGAGSPLATADRNTGVALTTETSTAPLSYAYPSGTIEMINGTPYILVGWTQGRLVVA